MIIRTRKGFSVIEFLIAASLTVAVVGSSTIAIATSEKIQRDTYYKDQSLSIVNSIIQGSRAMHCGSMLGNNVQNFDSNILASCKGNSSVTELNIGGALAIPAYDGDYTYTPSGFSRLKFTIQYRTAWLNYNKKNSCDVAALSANANLQLLDSQPVILRRKVTISWNTGNRANRPITYTDLQSFDSQTPPFNYGENIGSKYVLDKPSETIFNFTNNSVNPNISFQRIVDNDGYPTSTISCVIFPFLLTSQNFSISINGTPLQNQGNFGPNGWIPVQAS